MSVGHGKSDIKSWLKTALVNEDLADFCVNSVTSPGSKDGYMGDIVFVNVSGRTADNVEKEYDLVLKCGKTSEALRKNVPVRACYENEIYVYSEVFPAFAKFQRERDVAEIFDSIPACYGTVLQPDMEVIAFDNLNSLGYKLYDRKKPLTMEHINLVVTEYGIFHAISAAMQDQEPERYKELVSGFKNVWKKFDKNVDVVKLFGTPVDQCCELLKNDISENAFEKLKNFKALVPYIYRELIFDRNHFTAISHRDCWNNNFMFKYQEADADRPVNVAMLDWQISDVSSPVADLSYFLYSCMDPENLKSLDNVLKTYHDSFSTHLKQMGSNAERIFPYNQLLADWKYFAKFGIMMAFLAVKLSVSDQDEIVDFEETLENGDTFSDSLAYELRNKEVYKKRILGLVEHIVERDLI